MLHNSVALKNLIEHCQRAPGIDHVIFRDDFEPVHHRLARKNVLVVRNAETDSDTVILKRIESITGHG